MLRSKTKNKKKFTNNNKTLAEILLIFVWSIALVLFFSLSIIRSWNSSTKENTENLRGAAEEIFADIPSSHPAAEAVQYLKKRSIVNGGKDSLFRPEDFLTRAELVTMAAKALRVQPHPVSNSYCFPDVRDEWFAPFVCYGAKKGHIHGFPDGLFGPFEYVTNEQMRSVVMNFFDISLQDYQLAGTGSTDFMTRADAAKILQRVLLMVAP